MKTPSLLKASLAILTLFTGASFVRAAEEPVSAQRLHASLERSLAYLAKEGDTWVEKKNCNGCHHMPLLLWSHRLAIARGFPVDAKKLEDWATWSDEWTPDPKAAEKKGGLEEIALRLLAMPDRTPEKLSQVIEATQLPDGSWKPSGQFSDMQARGAADARVNSTRLFLLALAAPKDATPGASEARAKAAAFLAKNEPAKSTDSLVHQLLYAKQSGSAAEVETARKELLKLQRGDGGWSWIIGVNHSDALATGEVLYALASVGNANDATAIQKAQRYLLSTQREDGSWLTDISFISKIDRSAPDKAASLKNATEIYHYYGSGWATIGLLQSMPAQE